MQNFFDFFLDFSKTEKPSDAALHAGAADVFPPEILALKGRIQPPLYHPEGDAFVHTLLAVDRAKELGATNAALWATLLHDLGKAVTDTANLPHHFNHEALGVPLVRAVCDRLGVPGDFTEIAVFTAKEHLNVHKFLDLRPVKKVDLLVRLGNLVYDVTLAAQADAQGRGPTFIDQPYPQRQAAIDAWEIIRGIERETLEKTRIARAAAIRPTH